MTLRTKIYIGIAAAIITSFLAAAFWQSHKISDLESDVRNAKQSANQKQQLANAKELESAGYKQKIEYLENELTEIQKQTRRQDEKLERSITNSRLARGDVERAKQRRTIPAQTVELCAKLAELGHACE
jgi:Flp pilus assembly protein TadB